MAPSHSFNLLRPDIVQELSWINGLNDYAFPYQLQVARDQTVNLGKLKAEIEELKAARPKAPVEDGRESFASPSCLLLPTDADLFSRPPQPSSGPASTRR